MLQTIKNQSFLFLLALIIILQGCNASKQGNTNKEADTSARLHDIWVATNVNGTPIKSKTVVPRMEINLTTKAVMGNDGCNNYSGEIKEISNSKLVFGPLIGTRKMCPEMEVPNQFGQAMREVVSYQLDNLNLILFDENKQEVLTFLKTD